jgi:hypothetical protein
MKNNSEEIMEDWKIPLLLISLPAKPLINPTFQKFRKNQIDMYFSKEISKEQFYSQDQEKTEHLS